MALHASRVKEMIGNKDFNIFVHHFRRDMLLDYGYLLTLGNFYYESLPETPAPKKWDFHPGLLRTHSRVIGKHQFDLDNIREADLVVYGLRERRGIVLTAYSSILTHSLEFVGARVPFYAQIRPNFSANLNGVEVVCLMEQLPVYNIYRVPFIITNTTSHSVFLECGAELATACFYMSDPSASTRNKAHEQCYSNNSIAVTLAGWNPRMLIDKLYDHHTQNPVTSNQQSDSPKDSKDNDPVATQKDTTDIICSLMTVSVDKLVEQKVMEKVRELMLHPPLPAASSDTSNQQQQQQQYANSQVPPKAPSPNPLDREIEESKQRPKYDQTPQKTNPFLYQYSAKKSSRIQ